MEMGWVFVSVSLSLVLLSLAALHLYWGMGGFWPGTNEVTLVEHVVGRTADMKAPPFVACLFVATSLAGIAALVFTKSDLVPIPRQVAWVPTIGLYGAAAVFLLRGLAGYTPKIFDYAKGTPFYDLNTSFYSPLCIAIGAALICLNVVVA